MTRLPDSLTRHYVSMRELPDGRILGVLQLLYHWTMHVDLHEFGYEDRYCFWTRELAEEAMSAWDGTGDPINWHKHPKSGRRRDVDTGEIWHELEIGPLSGSLSG